MKLKLREFEVKNKLKVKLKKLHKKDKRLYDAIWSKINEVVSISNVEHYKNLRKPLQFLKRIHITKQFVLVFEYHKSQDIVEFYEFDHRDKIYKLIPRK